VRVAESHHRHRHLTSWMGRKHFLKHKERQRNFPFFQLESVQVNFSSADSNKTVWRDVGDSVMGLGESDGEIGNGTMSREN
jgi:hypothetical protein